MQVNCETRDLTLLALGANVGNPGESLARAVQAVADTIGAIESVSSLYHTAALTHPNHPDRSQPDYLNAVLSCRTTSPPEEILERCLAIEQLLGRDRRREERWGPRTIDIDILAVGEAVVASEHLTIPHYQLHLRDFVLYPLREILPGWRHPVSGKTIEVLIAEYEKSGAQRTIQLVETWHPGSRTPPAVSTMPIIAIPCVQCSSGPERRAYHGVAEEYITALACAGAVPLLVPLDLPEQSLRALYEQSAGVLLQGGEDVDPLMYGEERHPRLGKTDPRRDRLEGAFVRWCMEERKPFLGICRGIQIANAVLGGSLYQDLESQRPGGESHRVCQWDATPHLLRLAPDSRLARVLGAGEVKVNSWHHQAIKDLAPRLVPSGISPDNLIEAIEAPNHPFYIAVQCHPESLWQEREPAWRRLFEAFVKAAATL